MRIDGGHGAVRLCQPHSACMHPCANCPSYTFALALSGKSQRCSARPVPTRGASRSSRTLEAGCDGRVVLSDEQHDTDGEGVWSRRPDAGAALCEMTQGNGDNNARSHRGSRISGKTIARGRPDVSGGTCGSAACFFVARGRWVPAGARALCSEVFGHLVLRKRGGVSSFFARCILRDAREARSSG
jgi:hypothetical protein